MGVSLLVDFTYVKVDGFDSILWWSIACPTVQSSYQLITDLKKEGAQIFYDTFGEVLGALQCNIINDHDMKFIGQFG